jgi:hypothetical protein
VVVHISPILLELLGEVGVREEALVPIVMVVPDQVEPVSLVKDFVGATADLANTTAAVAEALEARA